MRCGMPISVCYHIEPVPKSIIAKHAPLIHHCTPSRFVVLCGSRPKDRNGLCVRSESAVPGARASKYRYGVCVWGEDSTTRTANPFAMRRMDEGLGSSARQKDIVGCRQRAYTTHSFHLLRYGSCQSIHITSEPPSLKTKASSLPEQCHSPLAAVMGQEQCHSPLAAVVGQEQCHSPLAAVVGQEQWHSPLAAVVRE